MLEIKLLKGEGEQRQGIAAAALLDIVEQTLGQPRLNCELALGFLQPRRRGLDHRLVGAARHGQQRQGPLAHGFERLGRL